MEAKNKTIKKVWMPRLVLVVDKGMRWLSSSLLRIFIVTISIVITSYLLYLKVWVPLLSDVLLPEGISLESIKLNTELLKNINEQRVGRIEHRAQPFTFDAIIKSKAK